VARYRTKDETDLRWNRIRRQLTRDLDTQIANIREDMLNAILGDAWGKYAKSLETGTKLEIESKYTDFVDATLRAAIDVKVDDGALALDG
jgi:hypothetical protein